MVNGIDITLKEISKSYNKNYILRNINLKINNGEFIAVVGKSGCGKSTLLRMISGLETPTSGKVFYDDIEHNKITKEVKIMFQNPRLLPWKNLLDNVKLGLPKASFNKAKDSLKSVGLFLKKSSYPWQISGGQAQRVSLARALASSPKLLLLDEPLGALDAFTRMEMQNLIQKIWLEEKFNAILVTHDVPEAVYLADRVILVQENKIILDERICLPRPRKRESEEFVNKSNKILNLIMKNAI
ncbi:ABC transporter ATP-binding protein [Liquorilactobacillus sicerae]|uniref:ABC transporter ATP-binding protein n=1 Tax=Liquorilactobacillus sicerae TaxID=1416943 RepID=UPI0024811359|nr:ABC transporter ATP-binding protein [Liquorilactobacillus sicerae]